MPTTRDYFAEMYVAGILADAGWNVYFPRRDKGFDFIATMQVGDQFIIRPVQVKGKYPAMGKTDKATYGYTGLLTQIHPEMVLAIPFFEPGATSAPKFIAFLPFGELRPRSGKPGTYRAQPTRFSSGTPLKRLHFVRFFDADGIKLMATPDWKNQLACPSVELLVIEEDDED
jgi:hypothetical protein